MGGVQYVEPEISQASRVEIDDFLELLQCEASRGHFTGLKSNDRVPGSGVTHHGSGH